MNIITYRDAYVFDADKFIDMSIKDGYNEQVKYVHYLILRFRDDKDMTMTFDIPAERQAAFDEISNKLQDSQL